MMLLADIGVAQDVETLRVCRHQTVLDAVVHHFYEMAGTGRAAGQVAFFRRAANLVAAGSAIDRAAAGCERFEDRIEMLHDVRLAANHLAIAALEPPNAAARGAVD